MKNQPLPYLCGGTFFVLLTEAKGKKVSRRQLRSGKKDRISNRNMLEALIQILMPSFRQPMAGKTFEGDTSDYRASKVSYGENLPFDDEVEISAFDNRVKTQYMSVLAKMDSFIDEYMNTDSDDRMQRLIQALLTLVDEDKLIKEDDLFYLSESPVTKTDLLSTNHYCLSALLLALWHFIVMNRPDNELGRRTFESWHERADQMNAKWRFTSNIGKRYPKEIDWDLFGASDVPEEKEESPTEEVEPEEENLEADVIEDAQPLEHKTVVKGAKVYQQRAEKIYNIDHIENFYG